MKEYSQPTGPYTGSNLLSQGYVYYEELNEYPSDSKQAQLYRNAKSSLAMISGYNTQAQTSKVLLEMAAAEREKEIAFLSNVFGFQPKAELDRKQAGKEIVDAFNSILNIKEAYERNKTRILDEKHSQAQIDIASFFDTYLEKHFNKRVQAAITLALKDYDNGVDILVALERRIDSMLDHVLDAALEEALSSKIFADDTKDNNAYKDLLTALNKNMAQKNWLKEQIYRNYKLDEVKKILMSNLQFDQSKQNRNKLKKQGAHMISNSTDRYRQGGFTREYLMNTISNYIISTLIASGKYKINDSSGVLHTGSINNMKADNILTFNIPVGLVNEILTTTKVEESGREANVNLIRELGNKLGNIDNGTIIYTSSKNYSINNGFKDRHGFSSGEDLELKKFASLLSDSPYKSHAYSLVGSIMQLLKGAVGEDRKAEYTTAIARYVAYFLFDDINTIGTNIKGSSPTALHLFDLNGIYIPLSFFLELLGDAFSFLITTQPTNLVYVSIKDIPNVMFDHEPSYNRQMWIDQGQTALDQIKISVKFLADFKNIIGSLK